jgi:hypothetical protein
MPSCLPPLWVPVLQALGVPVIAAVGAWIALQQLHLARVKLQHDLYDRRYAVFQAVRRFLDEANFGKVVSEETLRSLVLGTADAAFLFDDGLAAYLKEMRDHATRFQNLSVTMEGFEGKERLRAGEVAQENFMWLMEQIGGLTEKFQPFLKLDRRSRSVLRFPW